ncbi:MAG: adenylyl-sulfate kinase [Chitinophagales bacterium]|jgi:adenylylsulfate kinase|nr:adenylyl-sulfate kinase [Chitinophagales bacterium]
MTHLYPTDHHYIPQKDWAEIYQQKPKAFFLLGMSGSGKSTLGINLNNQLVHKGYKVLSLDGDNLRIGLNKDLGFSEADREENLRRVAELNIILLKQGLIVLNTFVCPKESYRDMIQTIFDNANQEIHWIYCHAPIETLIDRDPKGLYQRAKAENLAHFTGLTQGFDIPKRINLQLDTHLETFETSYERLAHYVKSHLA